MVLYRYTYLRMLTGRSDDDGQIGADGSLIIPRECRAATVRCLYSCAPKSCMSAHKENGVFCTTPRRARSQSSSSLDYQRTSSLLSLSLSLPAVVSSDDAYNTGTQTCARESYLYCVYIILISLPLSLSHSCSVISSPPPPLALAITCSAIHRYNTSTAL